MGSNAIVQGDKITGMCPLHLMPNPAGGTMPSPPLPFSAPLSQGLATKTKIGGRFAAVLGSSGTNTDSPHTTISDPYTVVTAQVGRVLIGSPTVFIEGKPAARASSTVTCCQTSGTLMATVMTVFIA